MEEGDDERGSWGNDGWSEERRGKWDGRHSRHSQSHKILPPTAIASIDSTMLLGQLLKNSTGE
jgi:hypothetical protein